MSWLTIVNVSFWRRCHDCEPIRACQLGDLRWSTPRRGDGSEPFGIRFNDNEKGRATTRGT
jgi:hypothetical protein